MPTNGQFAVGELVTASDANTLFVRGYGNRIINGNFEINQRGYTSGTNLASGAYGFDRWKSGFTNTALTFTDGNQATTVTISSSGVLQQIIERENMPAGTYILSWLGTATGRIYNAGSTPPGYTAGPITVTLDGLANVVVEFTASGGTRTLGLVQVEAGTVFSPFQYRHRGEELALCMRYYEKSYIQTVAIGTATELNAIMNRYGSYTGFHYANGSFQQIKRAAPTFRAYSTAAGTADAITVFGHGDTVYGAVIGTHKVQCGVGTVTGTGVGFQFTADAEL